MFSVSITNIASNTATANVLVPILADLAVTMCINPIYLTLPAGNALRGVEKTFFALALFPRPGFHCHCHCCHPHSTNMEVLHAIPTSRKFKNKNANSQLPKMQWKSSMLFPSLPLRHCVLLRLCSPGGNCSKCHCLRTQQHEDN